MARESLLNEIGNRLEQVHATPSGEMVDYQEVAMSLLELVEQFTVAYHRDGYLVLRDPADDVTREAI